MTNDDQSMNVWTVNCVVDSMLPHCPVLMSLENKKVAQNEHGHGRPNRKPLGTPNPSLIIIQKQFFTNEGSYKTPLISTPRSAGLCKLIGRWKCPNNNKMPPFAYNNVVKLFKIGISINRLVSLCARFVILRYLHSERVKLPVENSFSQAS